MKQGEQQWAQEEFGEAVLGDERRTRRLVKMAEQVSHRPTGKVTEVFLQSKEREGSFRFLEKEEIPVEVIQASAYQSTARRVAAEPYVYVPMDGSSLKRTDPLDPKGWGMVGTASKKGRGVQVLTALAVNSKGKPLGLLGQTYWMRKRQPKRRKHGQIPLEKKETKRSVRMLGQVAQVLQEAGSCQPWFQID